VANGPRLSIDIREKRFASLPDPLFVDLAIEVAPGTVLALVGPSGVGKSSLLRMIAGIDRNFSGRIEIGGIAAAKAVPPGFVFQDSRLLPWLSATDNILAVRAATQRREAEQWLERVGLEGYERALPRELSGGMQRRVALARALSVNPRLLLLDEPFVSLDRRLIAGLQTLLGDLIAAERATAVLVTHLSEDAARLADRTILLGGRPARIVADVTFDTPRQSRTAADVLRLSTQLAGYSAGETL
jgi:NitT/TauT family transport system ATP-binding protein/sulfonate transport system ATP-binding protein